MREGFLGARIQKEATILGRVATTISEVVNRFGLGLIVNLGEVLAE